MGKIPPRRVPSDDYTLEIDGQTISPHEGEWVDVLGLPSIAESQVFWKYNGLASRLAQQVGKPGGLMAQSEDLDSTYEAVCAAIGRHVVDWNWTDDFGKPLPTPDGTGEPIKALNADEIYWLRDVVRGIPPIGAPPPETQAEESPENPTAATGEQS